MGLIVAAATVFFSTNSKSYEGGKNTTGVCIGGVIALEALYSLFVPTDEEQEIKTIDLDLVRQASAEGK